MRIYRLIFIFLILLFLPSCLPSVKLSERAIVEAIGIDWAEDNYTVSVAYYNPKSNNAENNQTSVVKETAKSISSAIEGINSKISKKLYLGHNNFVVIGKNAAETNVWDILKYFKEDTQTKSDICVFVTENAEEIISFKDDEGEINPKTVLKITENSLNNGKGCEYRLFKAIAMGQGETKSFVLPIGNITEEKYFEITGSCLFKNGTLLDTLSSEETRGLQWYNADIKETIINLEGYDVKIKSCETIVKALMTNGTPVFKISISIQLQPTTDKLDANEEEKILNSANSIVERETKKAISRVFTKHRCDIFGFSKHLENKFLTFSENNTYDIEVTANCRFD